MESEGKTHSTTPPGSSLVPASTLCFLVPKDSQVSFERRQKPKESAARDSALVRSWRGHCKGKPDCSGRGLDLGGDGASVLEMQPSAPLSALLIRRKHFSAFPEDSTLSWPRQLGPGGAPFSGLVLVFWELREQSCLGFSLGLGVEGETWKVWR